MPQSSRGKREATQLGLGLVASPLRAPSPSQREMVLRAGTTLSIQQQRTAKRRTRADELEDRARQRDYCGAASTIEEALADAGIPMPRLNRIR